MKLTVSQLVDGENVFRFESPKDESVSPLIKKLKDAGHRVKGSLVTKINLTKLEPDYYLRGELEFEVERACDRCAEPFNLPVNHRFEMGLVHTKTAAEARSPALSEESEELDLTVFHGQVLDLSAIFEEQFCLSLPYAVTCKPDCRGICQQCGTNLNEGACECQAPQWEHPFSVLRNMKS